MADNRALVSLAVFPAPAGINRFLAVLTELSLSVPRASGDKPSARAFNQPLLLCSPRQRG
ncbi:hypothetical protein BN134_3884 [Cronobacter dublinensis 1210]|uniref:Transcriptional regulator, LysR family n=1 Tax=Cronobacter dublinensis 1210 TaxID=1208656 RepID=A0ABP1WH47_9ENTR|nr:hypothetical protein BN134_3884 [Cronobacter dublinensis 1210]